MSLQRRKAAFPDPLIQPPLKSMKFFWKLQWQVAQPLLSFMGLVLVAHWKRVRPTKLSWRELSYHQMLLTTLFNHQKFDLINFCAVLSNYVHSIVNNYPNELFKI